MEYPGLQNNNKSIEKGPDLIIADSVSKLPYNSKSGSIVEVVNKGVKKLTLDAVFPHYFYIHINDTSVGDIARTDDGKILSILENLEAVYYNSNNLKKIIHYLRVAILGLIYREYEVLENLRWKNLNNIKIFTFKSSKEPYLYNGEEWEKMDYVQKSDFAFDNAPTQDSSSLLTSGVIYNELSNKADLINGKVPSDLLPSYVDDVLEFPSIQDFPLIGESGKIYIDIDTNTSYRWTGSIYKEIQSPIELDEYPILGSTNAIESGGVYSALLRKQDIISDLPEIRLGAALGATALLSFIETDPTVPDWAKLETKPSYTYSEILNTPTNVSEFINDAGYLTTHLDISSKQDTLVSGENIKTINNESLLSSGNIAVQTPLTFDTTPTTNSINPVTSDGIKTALDVKADKTDLNAKQDKKLVVNIAINGIYVTADKTFDEIKTAYREGKDIELLENNGYVYYLISASSNGEYLSFEHYKKYEHKITSIVLALSHWELTERYLQERLTFDATPTANSGNPVTSGGIKTALNEKQPKRLLVTVTMDNTITADKSYQEIETAFQYGSEIVVFDGSYTYYHLISYDAGDFYFKATSYDEPDCDYYLRLSEMEGWSMDTWGVQRQLVSGRDIKTINNGSVLGGGNLTLTPKVDYASTAAMEADNTQPSGAIGYNQEEETWNIYDQLSGEWRRIDDGELNEIASITTSESSASGGNNTVTITETNGTSHTFNVKNGVDGADGVSLGEIALVQTTGDSEESVMSQKAVTEYGRKVTAEDLNGTSVWIRAKLTEEGWEFGKYVASNGNLANNASYCASAFIPVSNIKEHSLTVCYMYNAYSISCFCFYDSNKNYITGLRYSMNSDNSRTISIDTSATWDDVAYIRITCNPNKLSECYIKDNTANEYVWRGSEYIEPFCDNFIINSGVFRNTLVSQEEGTSKTKVMSQDALSGLGFANRFTNNIIPCKGITTTNQTYRTIGLKLNNKQKQLLENADVITIRISSKKFWENNNYAGVQGAFFFLYNSAVGFAGITSCGIQNALATIRTSSVIRYYPDHLTFVIDVVNGIVKLYWEKELLSTFTDEGYKKENILNEYGILKIFNGNTQIPFVLYQFDIYDGDITPVFDITQMKDYLSFDSIPPIIKQNYFQATHDGSMSPSTYGNATGYTVVQASSSADGYKHVISTSSTAWYPAGYYISHADTGRLTKYCVHIEVVSGTIAVNVRSSTCKSTIPIVVNEQTGETVDASNVGIGEYKVIGWGYGVDTWSIKYISGDPMEVIIKETDWHLISCVISLDCRHLYNGQLYDKEVGVFYPKADTLNEPLQSGRVFVNPTPSYEEFNPVETSVSTRPGHTGQMAITNNNAYISVNKDTWKQITNT